MPGKRKNWVEQTGGLPKYIDRMRKAIKRKNPEWTDGRAIATAVNACRRMCATGDLNFPGLQQAGPPSRAAACAAVADWERKKAQARADND